MPLLRLPLLLLLPLRLSNALPGLPEARAVLLGISLLGTTLLRISLLGMNLLTMALLAIALLPREHAAVRA